MNYSHEMDSEQVRNTFRTLQRNDSTHSLVSRCQQLKKHFRAGKVECDIPEFIEDQEIDLLELPEIKGELVLVSRLNHLIDQTSCRPERYPIVLLTCKYSDCNRHMRLPCSRIPDENDILSFPDEHEGFNAGIAYLPSCGRVSVTRSSNRFFVGKPA